ncbi:MAG TPA: hypothetical protein VKH44_10570 [Pirellulaceae bacterium]|nr:hypothetical protein [Pirellulaceae bacterium]
MAVHCSKCGEELLGAVNRCWKCGQMFAQHPEIDGRPPVRAEAAFGNNQPLEAIVVEQAAAADIAENGSHAGTAASPSAPISAVPVAMARFVQPRRASTSELIDARRAGMMAMGGTVASLVLGVFAAGLAAIWPPGAMIAVLGMVMGIWGLSSPRRNWALVGMLLCCLAIGLGTFGLARNIYIAIQQNKAITIEPDASPTDDVP